MNLTTCALNGGEDYELLFTVPIADHEKISEMEGIKLIGHITKPELGCALISRDGQEFELKAQAGIRLKRNLPHSRKRLNRQNAPKPGEKRISNRNPKMTKPQE